MVPLRLARVRKARLTDRLQRARWQRRRPGFYSYDDAWEITMDWFEKEWMPKHAPEVETPTKKGGNAKKR